MDLSKVSHLPVAAVLATVIMVGMPALARLQPKPADDPWARNRPQTYPAGGTLLYEDRPVAGAMVMFVLEHADEGREYTAFGTTDEAGRFSLRTFSRYPDGAVAGMHRIKVERMVPTGRILTAPPHAEDASRLAPVPVPEGDAVVHPDADSSLGYPEMRNTLPERFAHPETSYLTAWVMKEQPNEFLIRIHAEPPRAGEAGGTVVP